MIIHITLNYIDKRMSSITADGSGTFVFSCYHLVAEDNYRGRGHVEIHLWALNREQEPCLFRIDNYEPTCYIELPSRAFEKPLLDFLYKKDKRYHPTRIETVYKHKLFYYSDEKVPMIRLFFKTDKAVSECVNLFRGSLNLPSFGETKFNVWESEISTVRKLMTERSCQYTAWLMANGRELAFGSPDRTAKRRIREYIIDKTTLNPVPLEICRDWNAMPTCLSFDIETYTDNHLSMPNRYNPYHVVTTISCVFQRAGDASTRKVYVLALVPEGVHCDPIEGAVIIEATTDSREGGLITKFCELINSLDPDVILGYNIYMYDWPYMDGRIQSIIKSWPYCGRLMDRAGPPSLTTTSWKSSGFGTATISYLQMDGRICIDLFPLIKRDHKFDTYSLDAVSRKILGKGKHDVKPKEMFETYESMMKREPGSMKRVKRVMEYCIEDSALVNELFDKLLIWFDLTAFSAEMGVTIHDVIMRGQQVRCQSMLYDLSARTGFVMTKRYMDRIHASGGHVGDPMQGLFDNIIVIDFASMYPSIIRAYNLCYSTLVHPDSVPGLDMASYELFRCEQEEPIVSKSTEGDGDERPEGYEEEEGEETEETQAKTRIVVHNYCFVKPEVREGLVPKLVAQLVKRRKETNDLAKTLPNGLAKIRLTKNGLALKILANSVYGVTGLQGSYMSLVEMMITVTSIGRRLIHQVNAYVVSEYKGVVVYNDTDSAMVDLKIKDPKEASRIGNELADNVSKLFPPPLRLECEKVVRIFFVRKKMYAHYTLDDNGKFKVDENSKDGLPAISVKGLVPTRRDNHKFLRDTHIGVLRQIMERRPAHEVFDGIMKACFQLYANLVPVRGNLEIVRSLGSSYKNVNYFMAKFASALASVGRPVMAGDRLTYVIVRTAAEDRGESVDLGDKLRLTEMWESCQGQIVGGMRILSGVMPYPPEPIDSLYYIEHTMMNPLDLIFSLAYKDTLAPLVAAKLGFKPQLTKKRQILVDHPCGIFVKIFYDAVTLPVPKRTEYIVKAVEYQMGQFKYLSTQGN